MSRVARGRQQRRPGRGAGQDRVDGPRRAVDEHVAWREQLASDRSRSAAAAAEHVEHPEDRIGGRGRGLEDAQPPVALSMTRSVKVPPVSIAQRTWQHSSPYDLAATIYH